MFTNIIEFLETIQEKEKDSKTVIYEKAEDCISHLETFDPFDYFNTLDDNDIVEIMITLTERIENNEKEKAKKAIENDNGFHNVELKKAENSIDILNKIYNMLVYELY